MVDRVALISGGGSGIGEAIAHRFVAEGALVVLTGRRPDALQPVVEALDGSAIALAGDASDTAHCEAVVEATIDRFGRLDIVVANAGIDVGSDVATLRDEDWDATLATNLSGPMKLTRTALPYLIEKGNGSIVLVASVNGFVNTPSSAAYDASKAGLISLARSLAVDYGAQGIRANALCPGWVATPMADTDMDALASARGITRADAYALVARDLPLQRCATPDEIAACCAFLASDDASFVTGTTLVADGGGLAVDVSGIAFRTVPGH